MDLSSSLTQFSRMLPYHLEMPLKKSNDNTRWTWQNSKSPSTDAPTIIATLFAKQRKGPTEEDKTLWKAKHHVMKVLYMHGVLQGIVDFCDAMFGIGVVRETTSNEKFLGWSQNVQVLHL
jgi:hypothetical protein